MAKKTDKDEKESGFRIITTNRKVFHDFHIMESYEAGLVLTGSEIKSIRSGSINLRDSYVKIDRGEAFIHELDIAEYANSSAHSGHAPRRMRKLLLHSREIFSIAGKVQRKGLTVVPIKVYIKRNRAKIEIALVKSKKKYDHREDIISRDMKRDMDRAAKDFSRGLQ